MIRIYQLDRGTPIWVWLCDDHLATRKAAGFDVKESKEPPHPLTCDDCERAS